MKVRDFAARVNDEPPKKLKLIADGRSGAMLGTWRDGLKAVVKFSRKRLPTGKKTQRNIPALAHPFREAAFYQLAEVFGFEDVVPETVLFELEGRVASAQLFVPAEKLHAFDDRLEAKGSKAWVAGLRAAASLAPRQAWRKLMILDVVAGSRDRHANNVGLRTTFEGDRPAFCVVAWDNAASFGDTFDRYHNVFHKFLFRDEVNLAPVWDAVEAVRRPRFEAALSPLLPPDSVADAWRRLEFVREFPYRLPWKVMSKGHDHADEFPSYRSYFVGSDREPAKNAGLRVIFG